MKTTTRALIDELARTLRTRVLPRAGDASEHVRDVLAGLERLAVRIELEGEIIWSDIADQRLILAAVEQEARRLESEPWRRLADDIARELDRVWHAPAHYPEMAVLEAENRRLRALIDRALAAVRTVPEALGEKRAQRLTRALEGYMARQAEREAPLKGPVPAAAEST
ncbi:MAG: hypothetical protein AB7O49_03470 [Sphingomonadales bacterium]